MSLSDKPSAASARTLSKRLYRKLFGQKALVGRVGTFRERELYGLIDRQNYCYGMLRAADSAKFFGKSSVTVCEFGVATGNGLKNMAMLAKLIQAETGIKFRVVGFDTGAGLPTVGGYKDHPELWSGGDFAMDDPSKLRNELGSDAELIIGDIADTIGPFTQALGSDSPLGFLSIDVDIYSGTVSALRCLQSQPELCLPAVSIYLDDVSSFFSNEACGELAAVNEHNQAHPMRFISQDKSLPGHRHDWAAPWYKHMFACHVLDHPYRNKPRDRGTLSLQTHLDYMSGLK